MVRALSGMLKLRITAAVSLTCVVGYILACGSLGWDLLVPTIGLFLMACASSALNHWQESQLDEKMERTKSRPISSGLLTESQVLGLSFCLTFLACIILWLSHLPALWLCLFAMFWYNAIYTPIKRKSAFAVIPGALIGCLPPLVGWSVGGGEIADFRILSVCFFIFLWQVPHFWLLTLRYQKEYAVAGYPQVTEILRDDQISRVIFSWISATVGAALLIPLFRGINFSPTLAVLVLAGMLVLLLERHLLRFSEVDVDLKRSFMVLNVYALSIVLVVSLDELLYLS